MNSRLIPLLVLLVMVPIPAMALEAQLDNTDYLRNQTVTITGTVSPSNSTDPMHIFILQKNIWYDHIALPITEETFSHTFEITDAWQNDGMYTASIQYNGEEVRIPFTVTTPLTPEQIQINQIIEEMIEMENNSTQSEVIDNSTSETPDNSTESQPEPIIPEEIIDEIIEEEIPITNQTSITNDTSTNSTESIPEVDQASTEEIPGWIKGVFVFWSNGQISDSELLEAIRFLVNNGMLVL